MSSITSLNNKHLIPSFKNFPNNQKKIEPNPAAETLQFFQAKGATTSRDEVDKPMIPVLMRHNATQETEGDEIPIERNRLGVRLTAGPETFRDRQSSS